MTLTQFIAHLQQVVKDNPEYGTMQVIAAKDAEGNGYDTIYYTPSAGQFEDGEFISVSEFEEYAEEYDTECGVNAICVN